LAPSSDVGQEGGSAVRVIEDLRVGDPHRGPAGANVGVVPLAVFRLLGGGAVEVAAVRLDDESEVRPIEVDAVLAEALLRLREREPCSLEQAEELALQFGLRHAECRPFDHGPQRRSRPAGLGCCCSQRLQADEPAQVGFADRLLEVVAAPFACHVDQRLGGRGDSDAFARGGVQRGSSVDFEAVAGTAVT
jgi:hypothetical protein